MAVNCSVEPDTVPSDSGVAGAGVIISFIVTAVVALILSTSLIFQEMRSRRGSISKPSVVRRKLLNSYSDQQILTGIGIQSVGLTKIDSMVPYHFFIIWMLSLLSMAVHNATLLALVHDFRRDWVLRWLRQFLMFVNLVLSCVYGIFILEAVRDNLNTKTLPISCVWQSGDSLVSGSASNTGVSFVGTIAVIAGNVIVFGLSTWYLHSRNQRFYKVIQIVGLLLMTASAFGATARVIVESQAFGNPGVALSDEGEKVWSFGQLLSVGMLLLPLVSVVEILRGEIQCAPPVADDAKTGLMDDNELQENPSVRHSFQPAPFFGGSQANLVKK